MFSKTRFGTNNLLVTHAQLVIITFVTVEEVELELINTHVILFKERIQKIVHSEYKNVNFTLLFLCHLNLIFLFSALCRFQDCTEHITTGTFCGQK